MIQAAVPTYISYIRVSTGRQHQSGLGEEAQRVAVTSYIRSKGGLLSLEVQETQSGRKGLADRPELARALALCKASGAVLVIGKVDRLARDVRQFITLIDDSGVDIRFADMPDVCPRMDEGRMLLLSMANFAEFEGRRIGTRTRAALAVARAKGTVLGTTGPANLKRNLEERKATADGFAERLRREFQGMQAEGLTTAAMVRELNAKGITTARGGRWQQVQLSRVIARLAAVDATQSEVVRGQW